MKILYVLALGFLVSACGGSDSDEEVPMEIMTCESRVCSDHSGDADFSFIDINEVTIAIENSTIVVEIKLLDIPEYLTYSSANVPEDYLEYSWGITFDVDKDNLPSNDIEFSVSYFKHLSDYDLQGSLLDFTQHDIWQFDNKGVEANVIGPALVTQNNVTLTFTVAKNLHASLENINKTTPFRVFAYYNAAGTMYEDRFPDYDGYIK